MVMQKGGVSALFVTCVTGLEEANLALLAAGAEANVVDKVGDGGQCVFGCILVCVCVCVETAVPCLQSSMSLHWMCVQ